MAENSTVSQDEVMQDYLDSLLKEPAPVDPVSQTAARLLERASEQLSNDVSGSQQEQVVVEALADDEDVADVAAPVIEPTPEDEPAELQIVSDPATSAMALKDQLEASFQALFFEVAGLTLAVPLITLGGIHNLDKVGPLFGKPAWFKGVMLHREQKINVVDTAMWVMPEKYDQNLSETLNYQYLIMLGDSPWGLASDKLVNTVTLSKDEVKWRESNSKRPWLAGMVKERMCALVDVNQLILMLNNGLGSQD
ncbi:chemotaxis protein CheW [Salinimonas sp. HHU 13199]|uniref:Chemotaxis protein CheW n=1 Tax=Salinimonas profundi TaxID=2729140 RepID=A0ABR8LGC6_9ALTE|nr:chemotaxis protein CheW [Salinimonas profundi]MBD3585310.1 chemotaxis protein CheW [Salinimonas profundi]